MSDRDVKPGNGWCTCAECSSLGLDKWVGNGEPPTKSVCSSCGGPWPLLTINLSPEEIVRLDALIETTRPSDRLFEAITGAESFACGACGERVAMKTGPGRTYGRDRFPVPDGFGVPTCTGCGEEYLSVERAEALEARIAR